MQKWVSDLRLLNGGVHLYMNCCSPTESRFRKYSYLQAKDQLVYSVDRKHDFSEQHLLRSNVNCVPSTKETKTALSQCTLFVKDIQYDFKQAWCPFNVRHLKKKVFGYKNSVAHAVDWKHKICSYLLKVEVLQCVCFFPQRQVVFLVLIRIRIRNTLLILRDIVLRNIAP